MKDALDLVIGFIKGLMQPIITIFALYVGASLIASGKVSAEQAWLIPIGVITYWFADKSGIWDTLFGKTKAAAAIDTTQGLMQVVKAQQNTINNAALDLGASVPVEVVKGKAAPVVSPAPPATATDNDDPNVFLSKLTADLSTDPGVK
jgi:hypothetical protein